MQDVHDRLLVQLGNGEAVPELAGAALLKCNYLFTNFVVREGARWDLQ